MEVYLLDWSSPSATTILEPLQPLSIDIDVEEKCIKDFKVENISRGETVNNLIAELDKFKDETEPFYNNWVEPEKFQWPILDDYYSATYNNDIKLNDFAVFAGSYNSAAQNNASFQDFSCNAPVSATLPTTLEVPPTAAEKCNDNDHVFASSPFVNKSKEELLTPPDSPKEEQEAGEEAAEIFKLLEEMNPEVLDEFVRSSQAGHGLASSPSSSSSSSSSSEVGSECGGSILDAGEFSDGCASSPFVSSSDSGIDEQISSPICLLQVVPSTSAERYCCEDGDVAGGATVVPMKRKRSYHHQPYARVAGEEKRLRKKEQNKNAATRYRMKKKMEVEGILSEEKELEDKNKRLHEEMDEICREIKYLKSLMREVYKAKGLVK